MVTSTLAEETAAFVKLLEVAGTKPECVAANVMLFILHRRSDGNTCRVLEIMRDTRPEAFRLLQDISADIRLVANACHGDA